MQDDHSTISISTNLSRGLEESTGNEPGCNKITTIEDSSCSGVNGTLNAPENSRGSLYANTVSDNPREKVSEQSPCLEDSVNDSLLNEETRQFMSNENSSSEPLQESEECSSNHLANKSAISSALMEMVAPLH